MDRNTVIGLVLIFAILISFWFINQPTMEELEKQKKAQDSALVAAKTDSLAKTTIKDSIPATQKAASTTEDSAQMAGKYGRFSKFSEGQQKLVTLENDVIKVQLSAKGGSLYSVELKKHKRSDGSPVVLFEGEYGRFGFSFFTSENKAVSTNELYFTPTADHVSVNKDSAVLDMVLPLAEGKEIRQRYSLAPGSYLLEYEIIMNGMQDVVMANRGNFEFEWKNTIPLQEREIKAELPRTTVYYRFWEDDVESLSETAYEEKPLPTKVQWVSQKQQFFSTTLISPNGLENVKVSTEATALPGHIKMLGTSFSVPYTYQQNESQKYQFFFSANHYKTLSQLDIQLQDIVPLGWGIFGWVNQFIVIPIFNFLGQYISSFGIIILLLTLIIKTGLFPLVYKSYISTAKMRVLKPELDELKAKHGGDLQKLNAENMKLYKKAGVNPLGGCLPILLQMPILIALFSFFPSSFELRQQTLWWAHDLSQYDSIWYFGELPVINAIYGDHVSLFTLLMTISTLIYTRMNNQLTGATGQMKWLSYLMPVIFLGVFNSYAAGLTYYYTLSNIVTFGQQFAMRRFVNEDELHRKIQENKKRPESAIKKSKFQIKLEEMAKQQQALKNQKQAQKPKKK